MSGSGIEGCGVAADRRARVEAVTDRAAANGRLHGVLAAIVRTGIEAGAFADPLGGHTWTPAWRAVLALTGLQFRALARRCGVDSVASAEFAAPVLLNLPSGFQFPAWIAMTVSHASAKVGAEHAEHAERRRGSRPSAMARAFSSARSRAIARVTTG